MVIIRVAESPVLTSSGTFFSNTNTTPIELQSPATHHGNFVLRVGRDSKNNGVVNVFDLINFIDLIVAGQTTPPDGATDDGSDGSDVVAEAVADALEEEAEADVLEEEAEADVLEEEAVADALEEEAEADILEEEAESDVLEEDFNSLDVLVDVFVEVEEENVLVSKTAEEVAVVWEEVFEVKEEVVVGAAEEEMAVVDVDDNCFVLAAAPGVVKRPAVIADVSEQANCITSQMVIIRVAESPVLTSSGTFFSNTNTTPIELQSPATHHGDFVLRVGRKC
ncbi:hypothetical protein WICPIJ_000813 [Wickerhamomyces pijperi]|uniref:Uncharacterized protein n=1 Tax=Wickerhamomyces pijperi TaxID=599730 RepID=A0A9P8TR73_WICPI|nr:hypothetical protein WICPIJ_000813 [Wickerhamomyces pijperi]